MKIAIPVEEDSVESEIAGSFGRADYFLVTDQATGEIYFLDNSGVAMQGGAGIKAAQLLVDEQITVLLAPRCGENAAKVLQGAGIKLYQTAYPLANENLKAFADGKLTEQTEIHPGYHQHGANQ